MRYPHVAIATIALLTALLSTGAASALNNPALCPGVSCTGGTPNIKLASGGTLLAHPEIVPIFWESPGSSYWDNNIATVNQIIGAIQGVINSPYFASLNQYGATAFGGPGGISPVRMVPIAPIYSGTTIPSPFNANWGSVQTAINGTICERLAPPPVSYAELLYTIFVPPGTFGSDFNSASINTNNVYNDGAIPGCRGWGGFYNGNHYSWAFVVGTDYAGLFHELVEAITGNITYDNCTIAGNSYRQLADLCGCSADVETYFAGSVRVGAYWSQIDGGCVIPEGWPGILQFDPNNLNNGSNGWSWPASFTVRQAYAGAGLLVATDVHDNVLLYNASTNSWSQFGGPGAMFAVLEDGFFPSILGLTPTANQVFEFTPAISNSWTPLGSPRGGTTTAVYGASAPVATNATGVTYYYANGAWQLNSLPIVLCSACAPNFAEVADSGGGLVGLTLDHASIWRQATLGGAWVQLNPAANEVFASPSTNLVAATGAFDVFNIYPPYVRQGGPGNSFTVGTGMLWGLEPDRAAVWQSTNTSASNPPWTRVGNAVGRFIGSNNVGVGNGPVLYATGCNGNVQPCVVY
jgi:hypothetical protein